MKEKLIELTTGALITGANICAGNECNECIYKGKGCIDFLVAAVVADCLIANGVTVQRWIPVTERLPDTVKIEKTGTEYSEAVNVLTSGRKVITAIFDGTDFIGDAEFWDAENEEITHWTPVLLPLPDAPKDGDT